MRLTKFIPTIRDKRMKNNIIEKDYSFDKMSLECNK